MCATNDDGVASVTREVATMPVRIPAAFAISMTVGRRSLVFATVAIRPTAVTRPVAMAVAPLAESPT